MSIHEIIDVAMALLCGYFCGLLYGYRKANYEYRVAVDRARADLIKGTALLERMRNRLRARRIIEMRQQLGKTRDV